VEWGDNNTWNEILFPAVGGRLYGEYSNYCTFLHSNPLGSTGTATLADGTFEGDEIYDPWGQRWGTWNFQWGTERFAGMVRRDPESGLDHTPNRMYTSSYGRWLSPDPAGTKAVHLTDPQTWNMYAYVRNNPLRYTDPTGLYKTNCKSKDIKDCSADIQNFETNRQANLTSRDRRVRNAAKAYGSFNDGNNVTVKFDPNANRATAPQDRDSRGRPLPSVTVTFQSGMGTDDRAVGMVAHEGSHVEDFETVMAGSKSLTGAETEIKAYQTQAAAQLLNWGIGSPNAFMTIHDTQNGAQLNLMAPFDSYADAANAANIKEFLASDPFYSEQNLEGPAYVKP